MKVYTEVTIRPHHAGFGMWERGELMVSPESSFSDESTLLDIIASESDESVEISEALLRPDFIEAGVEDIRGRIHNQPTSIYVRLYKGELSYFGVVETEVPDDFFKDFKD